MSGMVPELGGYLASWLTKTGVVADEVFDMGESTERFMDQQQLVVGLFGALLVLEHAHLAP